MAAVVAVSIGFAVTLQSADPTPAPAPAAAPAPPAVAAPVAVARGLRLHLAPDGYANPSCAHNDGWAVDFVFHYLADPADALQGEKLLMPSAVAPVNSAEEYQRREYQRLLLERAFLVKVNTRLAEVLLPRRWEFSADDIAHNAITGGIFPTVHGTYDPLVGGHLLITTAGESGMEGSLDVVLQSGRWVREPFKVRLKSRNPNVVCG